MIVTVPFVYSVHGYEGLRRTSTSTKVMGGVDVMLRELSDAEAPVAARITIRGRRYMSPVVAVAEMRHVEGLGLIVPVTYEQFDADAPAPPDATAFAAEVSTGEGRYNPFSQFSESRPVPGRNPVQFNPRKRMWDDKDEIQAEINEVASKVVIVDGIPHVPCREPLLKLVDGFEDELQSGRRPLADISTHRPELSYYGTDADKVFRLDEWPRIKAIATTIDPEAAKALPDAHPDVEVLMPHTFTTETEAIALAWTARLVYGDLGKKIKDDAKAGSDPEDRLDWRDGRDIEPVQVELVEAWIALNRELAGIPTADRERQIDEGTLDRIVEIAKAHWKTAVPPLHPKDWMNYSRESLQKDWRRLRLACDRYVERPAHIRQQTLDEDDLDALNDAGLSMG